MGEMTKKPTVPAIRFKGFTDTWEQRKLSEISDSFEYGLNAAATDYDGKHKYIRITDIDDTTHLFLQDNLTSPDIDFSNADDYLLQEGVILFARTGASVGKTYIYRRSDGMLYFAGFLIRAKIKSDYDADFVFQNTLTDNYDSYIRITSQRSGQPGVNAQEYGNFEISVPKLAEQQKIGAYFSQLDNLITLHQRKLDKLHKVKRSLLERMFPRNGANVPEIRFSGFTDAWEQCELGAIIQAVQELTSDFENYPLYSLTIENGVTPKTERYERSFLITKETDLFKIVPEQCFVSNPMNLRFGAIGFNDSGKKVSVSGYYDVFSIDRGECSNFWCVYLKTANSLKRFDDVAIGSLIEKRRVHFSQLTEMSFPAPNMNEKKKLGEFFERLERLITLHQRKLDKLRQIKRSMLEKMFV